MWDDFYIGEKVSFSTTITIVSLKGEHNISENGIAYRVCHAILDLGGVIMKNTPEGKKLTDLIRANNLQDVLDYVNELAIKHTYLKTIERKIKLAMEAAFEEGSVAKQRDILNVLGFESRG